MSGNSKYYTNRPAACFLLLCAFCTPLLASADELNTSSSPEAERFEAAKKATQRSQLFLYATIAKGKVDKAWQQWKPPAQGKLLITKVKVSVDANGKVTESKILDRSGSEKEDESALQCLRTVSFSPPPTSVSAFEFYWTLMSDGTMNLTEFTDSTQANEYNSRVLGGVLQPNGGTLSLRPPGSSVLTRQGDTDFGPYMADLQRRIKRAWFPPKGNETKRVTVLFKIHRDGSLSDLRLETPSGVATADQAALDAVQHAASFRPLPPGAKDVVGIKFTFDYNVFNGGGVGMFTSF